MYCYSDAARPDETSERLRGHAAVWRDVVGMSDEQIVERIRADGIDILIDLNGHMDTRRLAGVFARRAAPVQVTYGGHPGTTALKTMDWRITDAHHDPPGTTEAYHTETLYRLPESCLTYDPGADLPDVGPLPAIANRGTSITFGAFNRLMKVTPQVLDAWRKVLDAVSGSKLMVIGNPEAGPALKGANTPVYARFAKHGIGRDRLEVLPRQTRAKYLELLARRVDVLLDPFPYAGETTTFDGLLMGVPVITLAGRSYASRAGVNLLKGVGLPELIASSPDEYVSIAAALCADTAKLRAIRESLRDRMKASPLADGGARVCRAMEDAFCAMWQAHIEEARHTGGDSSGNRGDGDECGNSRVSNYQNAEVAPIRRGPPPSLRGFANGHDEPHAAAKSHGFRAADIATSDAGPVRPEDEIAPELSTGKLPPGIDDRMKEIGAVAGRVQGWLDPAAGALLYRLARFHAPEGPVVELGSWKGRSSIWLASAIKDRGGRGGKLWSIDTWAGSPGEDLHRGLLEGYGPDALFEEFRENLRRGNVEAYVEPIRADTIEASRKWANTVPAAVGLLFIDASHDYRSVLRDFEHWSPYVAQGGYIVFDDVPGWPGPTRLVGELPRWYTHIGAAANVWVVRKG